jgi:3-hydroxyisobutyrate dehydrogenase-like beta-hydroxyacid dehydrogenase
VVATLEADPRARSAGRTGRTRLLPTLVDVVRVSDVVLSVTPPGHALAASSSIAAACRLAGVAPIVADLNAVAPATVAEIARTLDGMPVVDGSISGAPPTHRPGARVYLSGPRAHEVAALPWAGKVEPVVVGGETGSASALKMCTASVYKGLNALLTQAMRTAGRHGVLDHVLADLGRNGMDNSAAVARAATKAHRYVDEMRQIAAPRPAPGSRPRCSRRSPRCTRTSRRPLSPTATRRRLALLPPAEVVSRLSRTRRPH